MEETLAAACDLAAGLAEQAEQERRLPDPLVAALRDAGLFGLCVPAAAGGREAHPSVLTGAVQTLAEADAAAAWCVAVAATSGLVAGYLPEDAAREIFSGPGTIVAGVFAPKGRAVPERGGFRVSGRWPFASGCRHADWLMGGCLVDGAPRLLLAPAASSRSTTRGT